MNILSDAEFSLLFSFGRKAALCEELQSEQCKHILSADSCTQIFSSKTFVFKG